jgi:ABC-2 type transport system ATP-binding protein
LSDDTRLDGPGRDGDKQPGMGDPVQGFEDARVETEGPQGPVVLAAEAEADEVEDQDAVLVMKGASYWYGEIIAVNDVNLHVAPGITGLLGPNGAGKSTLMRMAMGLAQPTTGTIRLMGKDPWREKQTMRHIGYVPEGPPPWPDRSGLEATTLMAKLAGLEAKEAEQAARKAIEDVGLEDAMHRPSGTYSQGMQQRLKFAIAIAHGPRLLVLDEPLTGTDPVARRHLMEVMKRLADEGVSILISTHVLEDVEALTDRIALLDHGRLIVHGTVEEIRGLLDRYPRTVRVVTPDPKGLGALLWPLDSVVDVAAEEAAVVVHTPDPIVFHEQLQALLIENKEVSFTSVTTLDDNVEAVFKYLVESR